MCVPAFPRFVHHAERIGFCLVAKPKLMLTFQIPSRCFKRAVTRCLRYMAVNLHLKAIPEFPVNRMRGGKPASQVFLSSLMPPTKCGSISCAGRSELRISRSSRIGTARVGLTSRKRSQPWARRALCHHSPPVSCIRFRQEPPTPLLAAASPPELHGANSSKGVLSKRSHT